MAVERALRTSAPHALLDAVQDTLTVHYTARKVDLLMADYAMTILQPVNALPHTAAPVPIHTSAPGRAFGAQEPYVEAGGRGGLCTAHLPVSVRGDRIGILSVCLPAEACDPATLRELADVAEVLGHEIVVAQRDTDLYLQARRADRLTLAAEMQWQLLPGRSCSRPEYDIGAQLEPAYAIHGDNFDWSASADHLTLTVTNGMGEGIEAALLTSLAINALRNARRAGLSLSDQACLADQAVYGHYQGAVHLSMLLLRFDLATGETEIIDAGSPKMWRMRNGRAEPVALDAQLPLGMSEDTPYTAEHFQVSPGDRLLFVSDGVYDVASPTGERYSERALTRAMTNSRLLPPSQVPRAVLHELSGHRGPIAAADDALIVCLDWRGRP
ncbi:MULTISPECIES: PP2C family protein-serine/threonine phosphatase [unclassified Streptomyces]|uniref:PP2C family protein-serine/threonine phosphatase n=1 Tax=unclassified Streptomyces TaxID=2593676 RepID=UPI001CBA9692|nr:MULTISPECIES: PP2C family protein-serine/threonine phosphatase [unclassified Streptomyces]WPO75496.1 PP2C family protein-serine/threonine phosphatase [Streptomyces sp. KN37]